jgi:hypothetical protein
MNIRNLLLGSLAVAGLSTTGAYAADLGVLTSLDVCDSLGLSGLTISSDTNCLQITGEVKYKFSWGDYNDADVDVDAPAGDTDVIGGNGAYDWESRYDAWLKFVATADSDFGPAKAVLKLKAVEDLDTEDETDQDLGSSSTEGVVIDEAYVQIGDSTVIMAGKKGSIMNKGDDEPLNFLGLFNSSGVDAGVSWGDDVSLPDGGHVIQVTSDLGNGLSISAGLEGLDADNADDGQAGTAVGVLAYKGDGLSAHATFAAGGILDGEVEDWGVHAGFAGTFDAFKVVLAGAYGSDDTFGDYWNVLASASATFDMFTLAGSVEAVSEDGDDSWGAGGSVGFDVSEGVTLKVGGRYYDEFGPDEGYQLAASVSAEVTESITITGEVGYLDDNWDDVFYGSAKLEWAPGGDAFTSSVKGTVTSDDGYKVETEFKKTFQ